MIKYMAMYKSRYSIDYNARQMLTTI